MLKLAVSMMINDCKVFGHFHSLASKGEMFSIYKYTVLHP